MIISIKSLSASCIGLRYGVTETTARLFAHKVREAMSSGWDHPIDGEFYVEELVLEGKDQNKTERSCDSRKESSRSC